MKLHAYVYVMGFIYFYLLFQLGPDGGAPPCGEAGPEEGSEFPTWMVCCACNFFSGTGSNMTGLPLLLATGCLRVNPGLPDIWANMGSNEVPTPAAVGAYMGAPI